MYLINYCFGFNISTGTSINISITSFQAPMKINKCSTNVYTYYEKYVK